MTEPEPFEAAWRRRYPNARPVGFMLRESGAQHWLRLHSLPESKRYPDTDAERATIIARHNTLAADVLGEGAACWLVQVRWSGAQREPIAPDVPLVSRFPDDDDEDFFGYIHAKPVIWMAGAFDDLLEAVADDRSAKTLWMSVASGAVFSPYDGGVDVFLPSADAVVALKSKYAAWLSPHPLGL